MWQTSVIRFLLFHVLYQNQSKNSRSSPQPQTEMIIVCKFNLKRSKSETSHLSLVARVVNSISDSDIAGSVSAGSDRLPVLVTGTMM